MIRYYAWYFVFVALLILLPEFGIWQPDTITGRPLESPGIQFIFGTDYLGRDVFARWLTGGRQTIVVAGLATLIAGLFGLLLGILIGMTATSRAGLLFRDIARGWLAFPPLIVAMICSTLLGRGTIEQAVSVGIGQVISVVVVVGATIQQARTARHIEASYAIGASHQDVIQRHLLRDITPILITYSIITFSYCITNSAALSLLGLGYQPGISDWGLMMAEGRNGFRQAPWVAVAPGLSITLLILWANFVTRQIQFATR